MGLFQRVCVLLIACLILNGCSARGGGSSSNQSPGAPTLTSIQIGPTESQIASGTAKKFSATGVYSDETKADITAAVTWISTDPHIATIGNSASDAGVAQALSPGQVQIKATLQGISSTANLVVSSATLSKLQIAAPTSKLIVGADQQLIATALFSDGTWQDVTDSATWGSSDSTIATVQDVSGSKGRLKGVAHGQTSIFASLLGVPASVGISISAATIQKISIVPTALSFAKGTAVSVRAIAMFSDNSIEDVTEFSTWSSSNTAVLSTAGSPPVGQAAVGVASGSAQLSAAYLGVTGTAPLTVTAATLDKLQVELDHPVIAKGLSRQLRAVGIFSDGSKQDMTLMSIWSSTFPGIATVENAVGSAGCVNGVSTGQSTITAKALDQSASAAISVSGATLDQLSLWPATPQLALGSDLLVRSAMLLSDNTSQDVTADSFWAVDDTTIAQVGVARPQGEVMTGLSSGSSTVSATFQGKSTSSPLTVTSATPTTLNIAPSSASIATGTNVQLKANLVFSDGSSQDVTSSVTWTSSAATSVTVSNAMPSKGLAQGIAGGSASISANYLGVTGTSAVVDTVATIASIAITPANPILAKSTSKQLAAIATLSDGSQQDITSNATWDVATDSIARVGNLQKFSGRVEAEAAGSSNVTAKYAGVAGTTSLTVTSATLQSLSISPVAPSVAKNATQQFIATAKFSDGSSQDVTNATTWRSSDAAVAAISNVDGLHGLAQGLVAGSVTINAYYAQASTSTTLNVLPASIASIEVTPASPSVTVGTTQQFTATVHYSDSTTEDVTGLVTWGSSNSTVASISNLTASEGLAQAKAVGTSTISAIYSGHAGSTVMNVVAAGP